MLTLKQKLAQIFPPGAWFLSCIVPHLGRYRVRVIHRCVKAMAPWTTPQPVFNRHAVGNDLQKDGAHNRHLQLGLGTLYECNPAFGSWSIHVQRLHISCLERMAVCLALKTFLPALKGHHVLVRSDNMTVVAYINRQGGLRLRPLYRMTWRLLLWAQSKLLSLWAVHVPGRLNQGVDMLSKDNVVLGEWTTSPIGSDDLIGFRQGRAGPLRPWRQLSLPNQHSGMLWPTIGPTPLCMHSLQLLCSLGLSGESRK